MALTDWQQQALQQLVAQSDPLLVGLQCYVVGGAVRDTLLQLPVGDRDWVIVGASPQQVAQRGFIPVGGDFPVFLHPQTKEEFALARTERKSGRGYKGFTFYTGTDVTLEDDLARRDLTINAMAFSTSGQFYDPLGGYADLEQRYLRHVGQAFVEDPVRLLRLARFAARFSQFAIAEETLQLAQQLVQQGEVDALVAERVWQELHKGLNTAHPWRMLQVLDQCGALSKVMPGLVWSEAVQQALMRAVQQQLLSSQRFAVLCYQSPQPDFLAQQLRAPSTYKDLARLLPLFLAQASVLSVTPQAEAVAAVLQQMDSLRKPDRFVQLLEAAQCICTEDLSPWVQAAQCFAGVDAGAIAQQHQAEPKRIPDAIWAARIQALDAIFSAKKTSQYN